MSIRPVPQDPDAPMIAEMFDLRDEEWYCSAPGEYQTAAVETMKRDGSSWQRSVALEWPARINNSDETKIIRLLVSPEDAIGLADALATSAAWLLSLPSSS